jgi:hypothetical protein
MINQVAAAAAAAINAKKIKSAASAIIAAVLSRRSLFPPFRVNTSVRVRHADDKVVQSVLDTLVDTTSAGIGTADLSPAAYDLPGTSSIY